MTPQDEANTRIVLHNAQHSLRAATHKMQEHLQLAEDSEDGQSRYHIETAQYYWRAGNELVARINALKRMLDQT